jgi:hypothetical protein
MVLSRQIPRLTAPGTPNPLEKAIVEKRVEKPGKM